MKIICVRQRINKTHLLLSMRKQKCKADYPQIVWTRQQVKPYLGGALQDAFGWASGTHIMLMASDLETDPHAGGAAH